jgi:hypothetical protein
VLLQEGLDVRYGVFDADELLASTLCVEGLYPVALSKRRLVEPWEYRAVGTAGIACSQSSPEGATCVSKGGNYPFAKGKRLCSVPADKSNAADRCMAVNTWPWKRPG